MYSLETEFIGWFVIIWFIVQKYSPNNTPEIAKKSEDEWY